METDIMNEKTADRERPVKGIMITPVGVVRNDCPIPPLVAGQDGLMINEAHDSARKRMQETHKSISEIILAEEYTGLLDGIEEYSHVIILYWGHEVPDAGRNLTTVHPAGRKEYALKGIFATCSPARPNPILMTVVRLKKKNGNQLSVEGLDAIDNSPVLDIKPYVPEMYPQQGIFIPDWMARIMKEFGECRAERST